ncbi:hypothetical protein CLV92_101467 [Kineococcus xinjiangensis]|uniref:Uncharacterized protein n=1 Tax=Kineococcus xinjiangensis TaxID=512762 RepID=A0A2S6IWV9_9ACTN|nr:hypothetical protein CLV92_101467 [Kineococcus xinjiangensis]
MDGEQRRTPVRGGAGGTGFHPSRVPAAGGTAVSEPFHLFLLRVRQVVHTAVSEGGAALRIRWRPPPDGLREALRQ